MASLIALDTNVLVYAHRPEYPLHGSAVALITSLAQGPGTWAIPWPCMHEFYWVVTHRAIHRPPTPPAGAWDQLDAWAASPGLRLLGEAPDHLARLQALTRRSDIVGGSVHDARIAAICLSHGVTELVSLDRDFSRFPQLHTRSLLA